MNVHNERFFENIFSMLSDGCVICSNSETCTDVSTLPCGHAFHSSCLAKWLYLNSSCPICRSRNDDLSSDESEDFQESSDEESFWNQLIEPIGGAEGSLAQTVDKPFNLRNFMRRKSNLADSSIRHDINRYRLVSSRAQDTLKQINIVDKAVCAAKRATKAKERQLLLRHQAAVRCLRAGTYMNTRELRTEKARLSRKRSRDMAEKNKLMDTFQEYEFNDVS